MTTSFQNFGFTLSPEIVGIIHDTTIKTDFGFAWVKVYFIFMNLIGLVLNIFLTIFENKKKKSIG